MRAGVKFIDSLIRKADNVFEFCEDPSCILRLQLMPSPHAMTMGEMQIRKGETLLVLHVWNERVPKIPSGGADLEWALGLRRELIHSLQAVAAEIQGDSRYDLVRAIYGASILFSSASHTGGMRLMKSLGFTIQPYHNPLGKFGVFWENLFSWWLMWAFNDVSMESREFRLLERTEIWITKQDFIRRYGAKPDQR